MQRIRVLFIAAVALFLAAVPMKAQSLLQLPPIVQTPRRISVVNVPVFSVFPKRIAPYDPPLIYKKWWDEVQACTGLKTPITVFKKLKFHMVLAEAFIADNDSTFLFAGLTTPWTNTITVEFSGITNERLIKHEMTHIQMYQNGVSAGHPDIYFKKCNLVVE